MSSFDEKREALRQQRMVTGKNLLKSTLFLAVFLGFMALFMVPMGMTNAINTMMNTAYRILLDTVFYIMAIAVLAGALSEVLTEFGVLELFNFLLSPLMKPLYGMPGAAALGVVSTYFSDNPSILALAKEQQYRRYFKAYQIPALTNLGTAFGMGLIVTSYMAGLSAVTGMSLGKAVLCGNLGAVAGSVISTRMLLHFSKKFYGTETLALSPREMGQMTDEENKPKKGFMLRLLNALMEGGKNGVELGLGIIPGVLVICTVVMMLTYGPAADGTYTGAAYAGIQVLPRLGDALQFLFKPLFGFASSECVSVPITALGSAGASLGMVPELLREGAAGANDVAVFTGMCMCWSGYLSTHVSMMDMLHCNELVGKSILSHTVGGFCAGIAAHWLFVLLSLI